MKIGTHELWRRARDSAIYVAYRNKFIRTGRPRASEGPWRQGGVQVVLKRRPDFLLLRRRPGFTHS